MKNGLMADSENLGGWENWKTSDDEYIGFKKSESFYIINYNNLKIRIFQYSGSITTLALSISAKSGRYA